MVAFPVDIPASGAAGQEFDIQRVDYQAPEAGGRLGGEQAGFPRWIATWTLGKMSRSASDEWQAWHDRRRGAQRPFFGRDLSRPYPLAHIAGFSRMRRIDGTSFSGAASAWEEAIDADQDSHLTLHGLPAGLTLSRKDYVGFKWDAAGDAAGTYRRRALVRVVAGAIANAGGTLVAVCEPPVSPVVPPEAVAYLDRPCCVMRIVTDQTKLGGIDRRLVLTSGTIVGLEDLRP